MERRRDLRPVAAVVLVGGALAALGRWSEVAGWMVVAVLLLLTLRALGFVVGAKAAGRDPDED